MNVGDRPYAVENATVEKQLLNTWMVHHKPDPNNPNPNPIPHPNPLTNVEEPRTCSFYPP